MIDFSILDYMWRLGINKSQVNFMREASEEDGNLSHRSFERFIPNDETRLKP